MVSGPPVPTGEVPTGGEGQPKSHPGGAQDAEQQTEKGLQLLGVSYK